MAPPVVIISLFDRPVRASLKNGRQASGDRVRALAEGVRQHLLNLVPVVETLQRAGWEVMTQQTYLLCRHPSVQTRTHAEVALCQLEIEFGWYRICDPAEMEEGELGCRYSLRYPGRFGWPLTVLAG